MDKQVETVDHVEEARKRIDWADRTPVDEDEVHTRHLREAQAHASLAIAEQLERLNEKLDGRLAGFLDNLQGGIQEIVWQNTRGRR